MIDQSELRLARNRYGSSAYVALSAVPLVRRLQGRIQVGRRTYSGTCGTTRPISANNVVPIALVILLRD